LDWYNFLGTINTAFIIISLYGVFAQLRRIWIRKRSESDCANATALLSINQFTVSYFAYLSFFIYGYSIEPFNHYIVWPRFIASLLVLFILYEIWRDRKSKASRFTLLIALGAIGISLLGLMTGATFTDEGKRISTAIILVVSVLIAQGYYHQIRMIIKNKDTGAVDIRMSQFILLMDLSTIAFAISMGMENGWPLLVLAITSGITKIVIIYLFRWVKTNRVH
jgi:uncharacterized protein with PQ loop repeat